MTEYQGKFVRIIKNKSGSRLYRIGSETTSLSTAWFLETEIDELQQEIMQAKASIYAEKQSKEKPPFLPDYPCCTD